MKKRDWIRGLGVVSVGVVLLVGGCDKGEPPEIRHDLPVALPFPDTPDQLMANFVTAYGAMDPWVYRDEVLADAYDFVLQMETVEEFELPDELVDREDELAIAQKMFSGQPNADQRVLSAIEIQTFQPQGVWLPVPETDPYFSGIPGALFRNYNVLIYFNMQGDFRYEIHGDQLFYVAPDTAVYDGEMTPCYRLRGQLDQTSATGTKGAEGTTWGGVKALWH